jgi:hypothetical protein
MILFLFLSRVHLFLNPYALLAFLGTAWLIISFLSESMPYGFLCKLTEFWWTGSTYSCLVTSLRSKFILPYVSVSSFKNW